VTPIEIACPHQNSTLTNCGAEAGEPCVWATANPSGELYHAERVLLAAEQDEVEIPKAVIDAAAAEVI
jgi:hypothetical protein